MAYPKLIAENSIDSEIQAQYRLITSVKSTRGEHFHDFFELFLILNGRVVHCINGEKQLLNENTLVFIRDRDVHYYEPAEDDQCRFINLSFYKETIDDIFAFLGEGFPKQSLLSPEMPPKIVLPQIEKEYVQHKLEKLNMIPQTNKMMIRTEVRALLVELFTRYIMESAITYDQECPKWFSQLCQDMSKKENFVEGIPAMLRLSGKTHSYLCRIFKKFRNTSPMDYMNHLRMSYAENLLLNTDMEIIQICFEVGFENMGHFYDLFKRYFNQTPFQYRKKNPKSLLYIESMGKLIKS